MDTYLEEEVKEVFSLSVLKAAGYNVAQELALFLFNIKSIKSLFKPVWKQFSPTGVKCYEYNVYALTILTSLSTSFSSSLWYLNLGCGRLLLKSSSLKIRSISSCAQKTTTLTEIPSRSSLISVSLQLTGSCGLVMAQVIRVETRMNNFFDLKFSISSVRADCTGRQDKQLPDKAMERLSFF